MGYTISTHNGSLVSRDHNIRNIKIVEKEDHIDPNGYFEIWHDEKERDAYKRVFDKPRKDYNKKQTRKDRIIHDYYTKTKNDKKKHVAYEMIVTVGNRENPVDPEVGKTIMREFFDGWYTRNPNLELIGAYYHADEEGVPHVHFDYIPVATDYKKGMEKQTSISKALDQTGFHKEGKDTPQILWQRSENEYLEDICIRNGIEVLRNKESQKVHLDTKTYKAKKELENTLEELERTIDKIDSLKSVVGEEESRVESLVSEIKELKTKYQTEFDFLNKPIDKDILGRTKKKVTLEIEDYKQLEYAAREYEKNKEVLNLAPELKRKEAEINEKLLSAQKMVEEAAIKFTQIETYINKKAREKIKKKLDPIEKFFEEMTLDNGKNAWKSFNEHQMKSLDDEDERIR